MARSPMLWIGLVAVVMAILLVTARAKAAASSDPAHSGDPDADVLAQLKKAGSNLSKPHPLEFFLYFPREEAARKAADQLRAQSFEVKVDHAPQGDSWLCLAKKIMVPELESLHHIRAEFNAVAKALNGEYDGWGTPVVR
jgi:hypothetical protein